MDFKLLGSILLIMGTSIGAGILALPIATASLGFFGASVLLLLAWSVMTLGAFLILEVNLWLDERSHIISMAKATIGPLGQIVAWGSYLLLLYSLLCAYIAGGADLFQHLLSASGIHLSDPLSAIFFVLLLGSVVYRGIHTVDHVNRVLMFFKLGAYCLLILLLFPFVSKEALWFSPVKNVTNMTAILVAITSFGYASLIPSLRIYFAGDVRKLKLAILIGSLLPLFCYILWEAVMLGMIPLEGSSGWLAMGHSDHATSDLVAVLDHTAASGYIVFFVKLFTSICMVTSFLGVALCLADFLADGLQVEKVGWRNFYVHCVTFLPPIFIVLFFKDIFVKALAYAGIDCVILLILLPAWMAWCGRYRRKVAKGYRVVGGKAVLVGMMALSILLIGMAIFPK